MGWFWATAPTAVYELNDEQVAPWRKRDQSVWNEDARGRPLPVRAIARHDRKESRTPLGRAAHQAEQALSGISDPGLDGSGDDLTVHPVGLGCWPCDFTHVREPEAELEAEVG